MIDPTEIRLGDGRSMPQLTLGVWPLASAHAAAIVADALAMGYRAIDTAAIYDNEDGVGHGIRATAVARTDVFVTTKLPNDRHGRDATLRAIDDSLKRLQLDYVDLYLIHWPAARSEERASTWRALIELQEDGRAKSIGVSNFTVAHLRRLIDETGIVPVVNQVELHPWFQQNELRGFHAACGIATQSWSPFARGHALSDRTIRMIARKHAKAPAQIILRWHLDSGLIAIPRTSSPVRLRENLDVFDFRLDAEDMHRIAMLDTNRRIGPDPHSA